MKLIDLYSEKGREKSKLYSTRCTSKTEPFGKHFVIMLAGNRAKAIFIPQVIACCSQNSKDTYLAVCIVTSFCRSKFASKVHYSDRASDIYSPLSLKYFEKKYVFLRSESGSAGTCVSLDSVDHEQRDSLMEARTNE